ncbi:hypothetical protein [Pontibacter actiniarum]|uniref:Uncharacterized protein n=1 Tax=Pontibacter actiniarum TaxID=323450 RepID=A0A1X9YVC1_9BACT|nr:hypothetical protein [Pontibacter actiniarum]ARS36809.1 hypothetical protein CA264_16035 [Pontibacter actiniarum]
MDIRSIKSIDDRALLEASAVRRRVDSYVRREFDLQQLDLDMLLIIGTSSANYRRPLLSVRDLVLLTGYSESNRDKVYKRVEALSQGEKPFLDRHDNWAPVQYSVAYYGLKVIRRHIELTKMYRDDMRIYLGHESQYEVTVSES